METLVLWWVIFGIAAGIVTAAKSQNALGFLPGFLLGLILGPLGLLIAYFIKPTRKKLMTGKRECPYCLEKIEAQALICRYCRRESDPAPRPFLR